MRAHKFWGTPPHRPVYLKFHALNDLTNVKALIGTIINPAKSPNKCIIDIVITIIAIGNPIILNIIIFISPNNHHVNVQ